MAQAANGATASSGSFSSNLLTQPVRGLRVQCDTGSAQSLKARVQGASVDDGFHSDSEHTLIAAGSFVEFFAVEGDAIASLKVEGNGGDATYSYTVIAR